MLIYGVVPGAIQTTNATPNTENDSLFVKPGSARTLYLMSLYLGGKGASSTSLSAITARIKKWTSTASSGGTGITPAPRSQQVSAASATAGYSATAVTSGTGGPIFEQEITCGVASSGAPWIARDQDAPVDMNAAANVSTDVFVSSGTASLNYGLSAEIGE